MHGGRVDLLHHAETPALHLRAGHEHAADPAASIATAGASWCRAPSTRGYDRQREHGRYTGHTRRRRWWRRAHQSPPRSWPPRSSARTASRTTSVSDCPANVHPLKARSLKPVEMIQIGSRHVPMPRAPNDVAMPTFLVLPHAVDTEARRLVHDAGANWCRSASPALTLRSPSSDLTRSQCPSKAVHGTAIGPSEGSRRSLMLFQSAV